MNSLILLALSGLLATCIVAETTQQPLVCHECPYPCVSETTVTCKAGEMCATSKLHKDHFRMTKKGCLAQERCSLEEDDKYMDAEYKVRHTCCAAMLCNKKH